MRELYLLRHGLAEERGAADFEKDGDRPLTAEGRKKTRRIAKAMRKMELSFDLILSSPYARARETAEIVARVFRAEEQLKFSEYLIAGTHGEELIDQLKDLYHSPNSALVVGHEPYLSKLISMLLTGGEDLLLTMKKGGLCKLTVPRLRYARCATLEWLLTPRQIIGE